MGNLYSGDLRNLINKCLEKEMTNRPLTTELLQSDLLLPTLNEIVKIQSELDVELLNNQYKVNWILSEIQRF